MRRLSPEDILFLLLEKRNQPLHVGALVLLKPPPDAPDDFAAQLAQRLTSFKRAARPFDRRLAERFGLPYWEKDPHFDLAHHFVHLALPKPGRIRELLAMVSRVQSAHLDRKYPLWRIYMVEGLEDGRIALFAKIHHAMVDGVAGVRLLLKSMDTDRAASCALPPPWEVLPPKTAKPLPPRTPLTAGARALDVGRSAVTVAREVRKTWEDRRHKHPDLVTGTQTQQSVMNTAITGSRRFAAQSYDRTRIKAIAAATGASSNDVILAMCGRALRAYMLELGELPKRSLTAFVPVSVRAEDSDAVGTGNQITLALTTLATDQPNALASLHKIKRSMDYNKQRFANMSQGELLAYSAITLAPGGLNLLARRLKHPPANVIVSNVPGPRAPLFWQGCEVDGIYPASLLLDGLALNITLVNRCDSVDFGLVGCRRTLPSLQRLLEHLDDALDALSAVID